MLTHLLLLATLASPDAGRLSSADFLAPAARLDEAAAMSSALRAEFDADTAADQVLASSAGQQLILSTLLCEAQQRRRDLTDLLERGGDRGFVARQVRIAAARERRAQLGLSMGLQPLACDAEPVTRLLVCLSIYAPTECATTDETVKACIEANGIDPRDHEAVLLRCDLGAQVRAAERLETQP